MKTLYSDDTLDIMEEEYYGLPNSVFVHSNVKEFSLSNYKFWKEFAWPSVCQLLRLQGYKMIFCVPPGAKEEKWERMFGFTHFNDEYIDGYKLMVYRL